MAIQMQMYSENPGFLLFDSQENCFGFNESCFNLQQNQKRQKSQHLQNQLQMNQNVYFSNGFEVCPAYVTDNITNRPSVAYPQNIGALMENERGEIDQYIRLQNERLRWVLQEQSEQQLSVFLKKIESKATALLTQKELEMAQAATKTMELEQFLRKLEMEKQEWQRVVKESEAMVTSLNNSLGEIRDKACCSSNNEAEDAESFCCGENRREEEKIVEKQMMVCRGCNSRTSCMLFLPCRHLCSCKDCEGFLDFCPVCRTVKEGSLEALFF